MFPRRLRLLCTLVCSVAPVLVAQGRPTHAPVTAPADAGRPVIVLIHGRNEMFRVTDELQNEFIGSLRDGLSKVDAGDMLRPGTVDVWFVNYQDIFEPDDAVPSRLWCLPVMQTLDYLPTLEADTAKTASWWDNFKQGITNQLSKSNKAIGLALNFTKDTRAYVENPLVRCAVNRRLYAKLDSAAALQRPVILIGHSMGTLVAMRVLSNVSRLPQPHVASFVSIGTQLRVKDLVARLLGPPLPDSAPKRMVPSSLGVWHDFHGLDDAISPQGGAAIAALWASGPTPWTFVDDVETNLDDRHSFIGYLKHPTVADTIRVEWCRAASAKYRNDPKVSGAPRSYCRGA
jgi:pimeloyl-ACP methyl ester carboxylesterase